MTLRSLQLTVRRTHPAAAPEPQVPLFLGVLRLAVELGSADAGSDSGDGLGAAEAAAVAADAAECLLGVAAASTHGRDVAVQSGALGVTAQWLSAFPSDQLTDTSARIVGEAGAVTTGLRLQGALATAAPALVASAEAEEAATAAARALWAAPGTPAALEALHSLLFLLPAAAAAARVTEGGHAPPPWATDAQRGLAALLRAKLPSDQRQMALRAAASAVRVRSPQRRLGSTP